MNATSISRTMPSGTPENSASHLLDLPPEIRENIWRLVLGVEGETIHLYRHEYTESSTPSTLPVQLDQVTGKKFTLKPSCCRAPREWNSAYELSQAAEEFPSDARDRRGRLRQSAKGVLSSYNARHRHCRRQDIRCQHGHHTMQCRASRVGLNVDCITSNERHLNLSLLRVCRSIYFEAAHLPFKLNTFSFPNQENLAFFANEFLTPWQRKMIHKIEVAAGPPIAQQSSPAFQSRVEPVANRERPSMTYEVYEDEIDLDDLTFEDGLESSLQLFPNLEDLKLSIPFIKDPYLARIRIPDLGQGSLFEVPAIPNVQLIVGADNDTYGDYETGTREERRELAFAMEKFLQGKCSDLYERSVSWWRFLMCNGCAIPCRNYQEPWVKTP